MKTTKTLFRPHLRINAEQQNKIESICEFWFKELGLQIDPKSNRFWYTLLEKSDNVLQHDLRLKAEIEIKKKELGALK